MPVKRDYQSVEVAVASVSTSALQASYSARLLPDLPADQLFPPDYTEKINWLRRNNAEEQRVGWDYPAPMGDWIAQHMGTFDAYAPCEAIRGVRRPNGTYAVVACGGGLIKAFNYTLDEWVTIGSGYSVQGQPNFTYWQIEDCAGYAVFNNGRDLICTWQVGDAQVKPDYEFREQGYAACGTITIYNGVLICENILVIQPDKMGMVMNGSNPYGTIEEGGDVAPNRIGFMRVWSNFGNPRDFASAVLAYGFAGSHNIVMRWPMASLSAGDQVILLGGGAAGGNLTTTIQTIAGTAVTLTDPLQTSTDNEFSKATAIDSIVGSDQLEGDGSTILISRPLANQLVTYKRSGEIFQSYYTADVNQPFAANAISQQAEAYRPIRFPRALVNIGDQYHVFPGDQHFYQFALSQQKPERHPAFIGAEKGLFFDRVAGAGQYEVWATVNSITDEAVFVYPVGDEETSGGEDYTANRAVAYCYASGNESLQEIDQFNFLCASAVNKPAGTWGFDPTEVWFLMGSFDGRVTLYGETNLQQFDWKRYGEAFDRSLAGGLMNFGTNSLEKYIKRWRLGLTHPLTDGLVTLQMYGTRAPNLAPTLLATVSLADPIFPGVANLHFRQMYYQYRLVARSNGPVRFASHTWVVSGVDTQLVQQLTP